MTDRQSSSEGQSNSAPAPHEHLEATTRIFLRPIGTPLALGFLALGGASLLLSGSQLGWFALSQTTYVAFVLMAFAFPLQSLASVLSFIARDSAAATGMGILATSWLVTGLVKYFSPPGSESGVLGVFLIYAGAALFVPATASVFGKLVPALVLFTAGVRFLLTGADQLTALAGVQYAASVQYASAIVGLVLMVLAFYAALALDIEDVRRKTVLPVLRVGEGKVSVEGSVEEQIERVQREAGVREQL